MKGLIRWLATSPDHLRRGAVTAMAVFAVLMVGLSIAGAAARGNDEKAARPTPAATTTTTRASDYSVKKALEQEPTARATTTRAPWEKPTASARAGEQDETAPNPDAARAAVEKSARAFLTAWLAGRTTKDRDAWVESVLRYADEKSLRSSLEQTPAAALPDAKVGATVSVDPGAFLSGAEVKLTDGQSVDMDLMLKDGRWLVFGYEPGDGR